MFTHCMVINFFLRHSVQLQC